MNDFDTFKKEIEQITRELPLEKAITATRKGKLRWFIDKIVISRFMWTEAFAFLGIVQSIIIFIALVPQSIQSINDFLFVIGIDWSFSVAISSMLTIVFIVFIFIFGFIAVRYMGTSTLGAEYGAKTNPSIYLLWKQLKALEERVDNEKSDDNRS
jgi:hypothetical protein